VLSFVPRTACLKPNVAAVLSPTDLSATLPRFHHRVEGKRLEYCPKRREKSHHVSSREIVVVPKNGTGGPSLGRLDTKGVLAGVGDVKEAVLILVLLIDTTHKRSSRWQDFIDEDEYGLLWRELDALADDIDELANCEVCRDQVFLLVDGCDVRFLDFLANHWDAVCILLTDSLSFCLALLERVLVLKLGAHIDDSDRLV